MHTSHSVNLAEIAKRRDFQQLCKERNRLGATLAVIMATLYFAFICLVAFSPATLAHPIADGSAISVGVVVGVGLMGGGFLLTAIYVVYASSRFDAMIAALGKERL